MITIAHNAVNAKLVGAVREAKLQVREALSYVVDGFEHMTNVSDQWSGRSSFFDFNTETFPAGFVYLVYSTLIKRGYKVTLRQVDAPAPLGPENPVVDSFGYDPKYEYQHEVPRKVLKFRQIIAKVATGGGKSRIAKLTYARIGRPTMFLTTRSILMYQMGYAVERDMSEKVSYIGDGTPWPEDDRFERFTCAMVQTLGAAVEHWTEQGELERVLRVREEAEDRQVEKYIEELKKQGVKVVDRPPYVTAFRKKLEAARMPDVDLVAKVQRDVAAHNAHRERVIKFLLSRELVILEEAHEASGNQYYEIMRQCRNAHYRLALTGTPFMRESQEANMRLMACSGPVAITVTEKQLIDSGVLARPYFKIIPLKTNPQMVDDKGKVRKMYRSTPWPLCREIGIVNNAERNGHIVAEAKRAVRYGLPVMILVTQRKHGQVLRSLLTEHGLVVNYIFGDHEQSERQAALDALRDGRIQVLIGSTILDVGVDVPSVGMMILAGGGKAEIAMRQRIGRGLRAKKHGPNVAFVVDFDDSSNSTLRAHCAERLSIIQSTPGFAENIVRDFDYEGLGLVAKAA